ncbi:RluA family pseudouridine synthase [[Clostridium] fimetarium]|uniref:Pseudouridine synthase n=1 Tax=[Clostridium] fimetarium TaxID=99656 RepID=A0A1I0RI97_9FIRM|nr:RluA family pseudouridine synthase [[Clostridium] fimetarium]SEW40438.1 23S rRNA pseudouridine955/2504/2580 synthase [[Clostridium] fimetarium]
MKQLIIEKNEAGQRFDKFLAKLLKEAPSSFIHKMLRKKNITLNGKKADGSEKLLLNDEVKLFLADETIEKFSVPAGQIEAESANLTKHDSNKLDIVFENEDIIMINKPSGMLSQKAKPEDVSLIEYMLSYLLQTGELTTEMLKTFKPGICNRLDRNTSGIVVGGKTMKGLQKMSEAFKERTIHKYYLCIVKGILKDRNTIEGFLVKDHSTNKVIISKNDPNDSESLPIKTEYIPIANNDTLTLLKVNLITGRSHQIRAHLSSIGHPIIGDFKYGSATINEQYNKKYNIKSQLLHAYEVVYTPMQLKVHTEIPKDMDHVLRGENIWQPGIQEALEAQY